MTPTRSLWPPLAAALALVLTLSGSWLVHGSDAGVTRERVKVGSTPVTLVTPDPDADADTAPWPTSVVLAHGFAASHAMMDPLASALARRGLAVAMPDLAGHGRNPTSLQVADNGRGDPEQLLVGLRAAGQALAEAGLAPEPAAVVGHSMGAGAVVRFAVDPAGEPEEPPYQGPATIAISLPSADDIPPGDPSRPRNLLLMWGSAEPGTFAEAGEAALRAAYPAAEVGVVEGTHADGTARQAVIIGGREHIGILYDPATAEQAARWLAASMGLPAPAPVPGDGRLIGLVLVALGAVLLVVPISRLIPAVADRGGTVMRPQRVLLGLLVSAGVAGGLAGVTAGVSARLPLAVGGYLLVWFLTGSLGLHWWARRSAGAAGATPRAANHGDRRPARAATAVALVGAAALTFALAYPAARTWAIVSWVGPRWWAGLLFAAVFTMWFAAEARLVDRFRRGSGLWLSIVSRIIVVVTLLALVSIGFAPGFLLLLVPVMLPLLLLLAVAGHTLAGRSPHPWAPALIQAVPLAVLVSSVFPIITAG